MFGYFRFYHQSASRDMQIAYKNYYCGTCFALNYNYGQISRFLLSYDVVLLGIIVKCHENALCDRLNCHGQKKCKKQFMVNEKWNKVAAVNILLAAIKFEDDILDSKSPTAKIFRFIFSKAIRKAKKEHPELWQIIRCGYMKSIEHERNDVDVLELAEDFAEMMSNIYMYVAKNEKTEYVRVISKWLYFIDALDDYEKDYRKNEFNPLHKRGFEKYSEYINGEYKYISGIVHEIYKEFRHVSATLALNKAEDRILYAILNDTIPKMTALVINQEKLPKLLHRSPGTIWS